MVGYDHVSVCVCTILGMVCRYITAHDSHVQHTRMIGSMCSKCGHGDEIVLHPGFLVS